MDLSTKRNKIILGSAILGIILLIITIVTLAVTLSPSSSSCKCVADLPDDQKDLQPKMSSNDRALVKFSGYLIYKFADETVEEIFMPLKLESVKLISIFEWGNLRMNLGANCAKIAFVLENIDKNPFKYYVNRITVKLDRPIGNNEVCTIFTDSINIFADSSEHYACYKKKFYDCYGKNTLGNDTIIARLAIQGLEFEVDGDKDVMSKGNFSTPAKYC